MVVVRRQAKRDEQMDRLFHALADPTRRDIVEQAIGGELSVSALARRYPISLTAVQKHVGVLERAGLVTKRRHGREMRLRTNIDIIGVAHRLLDEIDAIWRSRLDRFAEIANEGLPGRPSPENESNGGGTTP